jgi:hypothetical protein
MHHNFPVTNKFKGGIFFEKSFTPYTHIATSCFLFTDRLQQQQETWYHGCRKSGQKHPKPW